MSVAGDIKKQIKEVLLDLQRTGTLGEVHVLKYQKDIFDMDFAKYPVAVLPVPSVEGEEETNRSVMRKHIFEILIIQKGENITQETQIEDLMETILDKFDNNPDLSGKAQAGVAAASSPTQITSRDKTYVLFTITVEARGNTTLTF